MSATYAGKPHLPHLLQTMKKRIKNKNAALLEEWHSLMKASQKVYDKADAYSRYADSKVLLLYDLEEKTRQHADRASQAVEQLKQQAANYAEKKDQGNTVAVVVLLLLLPLGGVLLGYYLATVTH